MNGELEVLRQQVKAHIGHGQWRAAAGAIARLQRAGETSPDVWIAAAQTAAALGDAEALETALVRLNHHPARHPADGSSNDPLMRGIRRSLRQACRQEQLEPLRRCEQWLRRQPPAATDTRILLQRAMLERGDEHDVARAFAQPLSLARADPDRLYHLIRALSAQGYKGEAARLLDATGRWQPAFGRDMPIAAMLLALECRRADRALAYARHGPDDSSTRYLATLAAHLAHRWAHLERIRPTADDLAGYIAATPSWRPPLMHVAIKVPGWGERVLQRLARQAARGAGHRPAAASVGRRCRHDLEQPMRVAYLSGDFRQHASAFLFGPVLEAHERQAFRWIGLDNSRDDRSDQRARVLAAFDEVVDVRPLDDAELAERIEALGIDVLVDLSGWTHGSRSAVLARRPAPVSINWLGFAGSMGGLADYTLADRTSVPPDSERFFDERLILLDRSYLPGGDALIPEHRASKADNGLPADATVLAAFNQTSKLSRDDVALWRTLLELDGNAVLWLLSTDAYGDARLREALHEAGLSLARVHFAARLPDRAAHIRRLGAADLALDNQPYTMHTTAIDCIAAGVPYLAYPGDRMAARVSSSLLHTAGLSQYVCRDRGDYEHRCQSWLADPGSLKTARRDFERARSTGDVFDSEGLARRLEVAYRRAHRDAAAGGDGVIRVDGTQPEAGPRSPAGSD